MLCCKSDIESQAYEETFRQEEEVKNVKASYRSKISNQQSILHSNSESLGLHDTKLRRPHRKKPLTQSFHGKITLKPRT